MLINLTYASFKFKSEAVDIFEQFFINHFPSIEILFIASDIRCMKANSENKKGVFQNLFGGSARW